MAKSKEIKMLVQRLAAMEQFIFLLQEAHSQADYHRNEAVKLSLANANSALSQAVKILAQEEISGAEKLTNVAWFYAKFARDLLSAEATEHLLGHDQFLDLIPTGEQTKQRLSEIMGRPLGKLCSTRYSG